jgi:hypothetical protein
MMETAVGARTGSLREWIVAHDDSKLFVGLYVSLALVLSIAIGLFWLLALLLVHLAFEVLRHRHLGESGAAALGAAVWAVRLDVALFLFALVLALHLQFVFGVLGLHAAGRAGVAAQAGLRGARFAAWEKVIRGILLSADDAVQGARGLATLRKKPPAEGAEIDAATSVPTAPPAAERWSRGDTFTVTLAFACILLILLAPWLGHDGWNAVVSLLAAELRPFPVR